MVTISLLSMDLSSVKQYAIHIAYVKHLQVSLVKDLLKLLSWCSRGDFELIQVCMACVRMKILLNSSYVII